MPIYEYACKKCGEIFSVLQKMGSNEKATVCPKCGSQDVSKKISAFSCSSGGSTAGGFTGG